MGTQVGLSTIATSLRGRTGTGGVSALASMGGLTRSRLD